MEKDFVEIATESDSLESREAVTLKKSREEDDYEDEDDYDDYEDGFDQDYEY